MYFNEVFQIYLSNGVAACMKFCPVIELSQIWYEISQVIQLKRPASSLILIKNAIDQKLRWQALLANEKLPPLEAAAGANTTSGANNGGGSGGGTTPAQGQGASARWVIVLLRQFFIKKGGG